ncbi:hypothetical protein FBULB1_11456 [Fusarium bulbicola]|nr:hypothetical protein FBULB1_11456 [Fusarium bulbicola]
MTAASRQEDVFGGSPNHPSIFPNDFNSKNLIEKLAEVEGREGARKAKLDGEVAELQQSLSAAPRLAEEKEYNRGFAWQGFRLRRTSTAPGDSSWPTSTWTVSSTYSTDRYLAVNPITNKVESQSGRSVGDAAQYQEWYNGLNTAKTGYIFESRSKTYLTMENPGDIKNEKAIAQVGKTEADGQIWHIILK